MIIEIFVNNSGFPYENAKNGKKYPLDKNKDMGHNMEQPKGRNSDGLSVFTGNVNYV